MGHRRIRDLHSNRTIAVAIPDAADRSCREAVRFNKFPLPSSPFRFHFSSHASRWPLPGHRKARVGIPPHGPLNVSPPPATPTTRTPLLASNRFTRYRASPQMLASPRFIDRPSCDPPRPSITTHHGAPTLLGASRTPLLLADQIPALGARNTGQRGRNEGITTGQFCQRGR